MWWTGKLKCRICNHEQIGVVNMGGSNEEPDSVECSNCGGMSCDPVEEGDECLT